MMERIFMAQISDIGGLEYGGKKKMENDAKNAGMSLGLTGQPQIEGGGDAPRPRTQPTAMPPKKLNLGPASDFIINGPPKGNNPVANVMRPMVLNEDAQNFKSSMERARQIMEKSQIPFVKKMAAEYIKNAAINRTIQRLDFE